jgi:NarL family two-component system sensor histidine kinase LiaS
MSTGNSIANRTPGLRWKLTLSYTVVTVGALLTVELVLLTLFGAGLVVLLYSGFLPAQLIQAASAEYAPALRYYLAQIPPDQESIANWLEYVGAAYSETIPLTFEATDEMLVVGSDGRLLGTRPPDLLGSDLIGQPLDIRAIPGLESPLQAALGGEEAVEQLYTLTKPGDKVLMTVPIWDAAHEQVLGVLVALGEVPTITKLLGDIAPILGVSLLFFTLVAGLAGMAYGFLAARGPMDRLNQLAEATMAWSQGDLSISVEDPSGDEIGQLAQRLNHMAQQLQQLIDTRRELVVVEERNRLARELHDSAKQQAFAAAAQINAARTSLKNNPDAAEAYLKEAERLIYDLRRELANLIQQLRPVVLHSKGLVAAIREYAEDWSRQNRITLEVRVQRERSLPLEIEQAIFRIVQESLANIARHSEASSGEIELVYTKLDVTCSVRDNGIGFDLDKRHTGFGLRSMDERADALGSKLTLESLPGKGTSVVLTIPLREYTG